MNKKWILLIGIQIIHGSHSLQFALTWVTLFALHCVPRNRSPSFFFPKIMYNAKPTDNR